ncbi:TetR/AcrR family transcriptional regulator [Nocardioides mangrovi]|uniref:TetR/AcrR family transcriptional regulator n=1 Tax=Nocardioides mangrovi TaxID=2874580 RepID=A0ABS7UFQ8_9ACTN|nr:TetR/AcrR family transcriptional regulator [Nocardioides mangrovi]MBZ5739853.1 TetR/AcrR family transcriptional regulator [Nocardioides mangrovi]
MATQSTGERLHAAALTLFAERGYHGTGIRQLADAAGLSSASLYHYMGTKEDLLVAIMRASLGELVEKGEGIAADLRRTPRDRLVDLVGLHVTTHALAPDQTRVVDDEVRVLSTEARREVVALRDRYEAAWQRVLEDGAAAGSFTMTDPALTRRALLEMCSGVARWWTPRGPLGPDEVAGEYAVLALRLVGARPRRVVRDTPRG